MSTNPFEPPQEVNERPAAVVNLDRLALLAIVLVVAMGCGCANDATIDLKIRPNLAELKVEEVARSSKPFDIVSRDLGSLVTIELSENISTTRSWEAMHIGLDEQGSSIRLVQFHSSKMASVQASQFLDVLRGDLKMPVGSEDILSSDILNNLKTGSGQRYISRKLADADVSLTAINSFDPDRPFRIQLIVYWKE
jgi:hypothetical protein